MLQKKSSKKEKQLEILVEELLKTRPSQKIIQERTHELGIEYSEDLILQMSLVLEATSSLMSERKNNKNESNGGLHV